MRKVINCYADFETTTLPDGVNSVSEFFDIHKKEFDTTIYSWNIKWETTKTNIFPKGDFRSRIDSKEKLTDIYGISADSFYETLINANADIVMWFNNLKGWDGHFILPLLESKGFKPCYNENYVDSLPEKEMRAYYYRRMMERRKQWEKIIFSNPVNVEKYEEMGGKAEKWLEKRLDAKMNLLLPFEYKLMVNKNHQIYQIEIGLPTAKRTNGEIKPRRLVIKDSLVLFPMSIKNMGKTLKKKYGGDKWNKMVLDGGYTRDKVYNSFEDFEKDGNQVDYLLQDTYILYHYHKLMEKVLPRKKWKLTSASTAYNEWYRILGKKLFTKKFTNSNLILTDYFGKEYVKDDNGKFINIDRIKDRLIEDLLPTTWLDFICDYDENLSTHNYMYNWYSGGETLVNEKHRGKMLSNVSVFDINSSYPAQMNKEIGAPIGNPIIGDTKKKEYNWKLYIITMKKRIVNKKGLPFLFDVNGGKREYLTVLNIGQTININSYELDYMKKYYNFKLEDHNYQVKYSFKTTPMRELFGDYVDKFYQMKEDAAETGDVGQKNVAKLFLNSLYGKMGTKSIRESRTRLEGDWILTQETLESNYYLPLAIAITSLARLHLVDAVGENYEDFVYGDTDSIFVKDYDKDKFKNMVVDKTILGAWDREYEGLIGIARRPKQYLYKKPDGTVKVGFAGINFDIATLGKNDMEAYEASLSLFKDMSFEKFLTGITIHNQLTSTRLKSGVVLNPTTKEIKPVWDYHKLTRQERYKPEHFKKDIILAQKFDNMI